MPENLMCSTQKANSSEFNKEYSRIFADNDLAEVAVLEVSLDAEGRINASEVEKGE